MYHTSIPIMIVVVMVVLAVTSRSTETTIGADGSVHTSTSASSFTKDATGALEVVSEYQDMQNCIYRRKQNAIITVIFT